MDITCFIIWLFCFAVTIFILHQREQLTAFLFVLALFMWPMALIAAAMLPREGFYPGSVSRSAVYGDQPVSSKLEGKIFKD
jgi:hypothetical protein